MTDREIIVAVARSLYWGYVKDTTGTPGKWSDLVQEEREVWISAGWRATRKIHELRSPQPHETAND